MLDERIVLGWAHAGVCCPAGVTSHRFENLDLLLIAPNKAADARNRLHWQVTCFDHGIDFVPTAPASVIPQTNGVRLARKHAARLTQGLEQLNGMGQLTLGLSWSGEARPDAAKTGRDWLAQRRHYHQSDSEKQAAATTLLNDLECHGLGTSTRPHRTRIERDVLLPRAQFQAAVSDLCAKAKTLQPSTLSLAVTGLWPPFSFVQPFFGNACSWD